MSLFRSPPSSPPTSRHPTSSKAPVHATTGYGSPGVATAERGLPTRPAGGCGSSCVQPPPREASSRAPPRDLAPSRAAIVRSATTTCALLKGGEGEPHAPRPHTCATGGGSAHPAPPRVPLEGGERERPPCALRRRRKERGCRAAGGGSTCPRARPRPTSVRHLCPQREERECVYEIMWLKP